MNYRALSRETTQRRAALQSKVAATKETLVAMEAELRLLDGILRALPKSGEVGSTGAVASGRRSTGRRSTGRRSAGRRSTTPSPAKPHGKWKPGRPGRPPKWYVEQQAAEGGKGSKTRTKTRTQARTKTHTPKAPAVRRAKRPPSEKQLAALAKARAVRAAKRAAENATPEVAE